MDHALYLFNPESDLALADNSPTYLPPNRIRRMSTDLSTLPRWYAPKGSYTSIAEIVSSKNTPCHIEPWGWNNALIHQLKKANMPVHLYPNEQQMECLRQLSHRSTAIKTFNQLPPNPFYCGSPTELYNIDALHAFVASHPKCLLKSPWSGSGKGLCFIQQKLASPQIAWSKKTLKQQSCIVAETLYNKKTDFAMEFYADQQGNIQFAGHSLFFTDSKGAYQESLLASNEEITNRLSSYIPIHILKTLEQQLLQILPGIINKQYTGYFGIDMMICKFTTPPIYRIHPCVELNIRMTMGMVARLLTDKYLSNNATGRFLIQYNPCPSILSEEDEQLRQTNPLLREPDNSIKSGYLALTPITPSTHFQARLFAYPKS